MFKGTSASAGIGIGKAVASVAGKKAVTCEIKFAVEV